MYPLKSLPTEISHLIGLSQKELAVFNAIASLKMGGTATKLAELSCISRTTVIYNLKKLQKRKLITRFDIGKRDYWRLELNVKNGALLKRTAITLLQSFD